MKNKFWIFKNLISHFSRIPSYFRDLLRLRKQRNISEKGRADFPLKYFPVLCDKSADAGVLSGDYFHQDLLVAKKIFAANPTKHVDIGSRIDGFVAHVAVFREIEVLDIRALKSNVENINFTKADLMQLPENMINYSDSVSALHSIEHFGLGRYGDPIDYDGHLKAIKNITQILKPSGVFYFSVPIGRQRIEFNAHRVFSIPYLWNILKEDYDLLSFSYVDSAGNLRENVDLADESVEADSLMCEYGLGIFELRRR